MNEDFNADHLDNCYPLQVDVCHMSGNMGYGGRTFNPGHTEVVMTFRLSEREGFINNIAQMYYQFDKFMKERYGDHIQAYQDAKRARRIESQETEPETDTGRK